MSGQIPAPCSYDDGDQSPLKGLKSQSLRTQWASGMDYSPYNPQFHYLSDWMKVIFSGDYQSFLKMIEGKNEEELKKMISRRETLCNVSAIFHVIKGARTLGNNNTKTKSIYFKNLSQFSYTVLRKMIFLITSFLLCKK